MRFVFSIVVAIMLVRPLVGQAGADQVQSVPVVLRPDTEHGSCSIGFRVNDRGAPLRSGPRRVHPAIANLKAGHVVSGCDGTDLWEGIIDGLDETCSVGIMITKEQAYAGPCASGWVEQKFLTSIYG